MEKIMVEQGRSPRTLYNETLTIRRTSIFEVCLFFGLWEGCGKEVIGGY